MRPLDGLLAATSDTARFFRSGGDRASRTTAGSPDAAARDWWKQDVGPLVAWHGEAARSGRTVRGAARSLHDDQTRNGRAPRRRPCARRWNLPPRPSPSIRRCRRARFAFRDLLLFSFRHSSGSIGRIALAVITIGLLSLVAPLITEVLINSVIPRTELDQLVFCALALAVTAIAMAGVQAMEGLAMLRLEGLIDWKLQAAVIDRMLQPAGVAVSRIHGRRFRRTIDGRRRSAADLHRTCAARHDGGIVRLGQHRPDVLL